MTEINPPLALTFKVRRHAPELIVPTKPTPRELKPLSDYDNQENIRFQAPLILAYREDQKMRSKNPASVIREALGKLLVFYYPFAGRLREGPTGKLMVDCSGEGVLFIEAEVDVTLDQFGEALHPPHSCMEEFLYDVPGSVDMLDTPLLVIQVTRLLCGSFFFAIRFNHAMSDAAGIVQFMVGLGEIARGATSPSILPVWQRELIYTIESTHMSFTHHENNQVVDTKRTMFPPDAMARKSLFFTTTEISTIRKLIPKHLQTCSTFQVLTACLWRCRTIALQPNLEDKIPIIWPVNAHKRFKPPLPAGYYGNTLAFAAAISTARDLCNKPLGYALELVKKAKFDVTKEYTRYISDLLAVKRQFETIDVRPHLVTDLTRAPFDVMDFGWGKAAYGGGASNKAYIIPTNTSFFVKHRNSKGKSGILLSISLPSVVMDNFFKEVDNMLAQGKNGEVLLEHQLPTLSKL